MKKNRYKYLIYVILFLSIISPFNKSKIRKTEVDINSLKSFPYSKGMIYITDNSNNILLNDKDLQVIDESHLPDSNMRVLDSYKINSLKEMREIITILKDYNDNSQWSRNTNSMEKEWIIHNICYHMNIFVNRTRSVDFNNSDELTCLKLIKY